MNGVRPVAKHEPFSAALPNAAATSQIRAGSASWASWVRIAAPLLGNPESRPARAASSRGQSVL